MMTFLLLRTPNEIFPVKRSMFKTVDLKRKRHEKTSITIPFHCHWNFGHLSPQVWDLFYKPDNVREMLVKKIQEETLRTYLFTYSKVYDSISLVSPVVNSKAINRCIFHAALISHQTPTALVGVLNSAPLICHVLLFYHSNAVASWTNIGCNINLS